MAGVSDTARLIASLELQDKFSKTANRFGQTVGGLERQTTTLGRIGGQVNAGLASAATNLTRIGIIGGGLLGVGIARGIASLRELEEVQVATRTVIESTGAVAGVSAEKVRALAEEYESLNATMDDKVIQSAENLLLTFTNIRKEAFEPALKAALDMNEAMGGGEEGLQGTIIQLGKALQDPVKGFTSLRRVGVNLSAEQQKQIKILIEQNDLYGAQKIILDELSTEFGGRFAAAGTTATGKFAKLKDAIEDAQMALATAFLPVLSKVSDKLTTLLVDPKVLAQIQAFGEGLAGGLDEVVEFAGKVPWAQIGTSLQIAGAGAKVLLNAFVSLPPWVQTAVITGWGLNKLTGGALGNIVGALGSGLIKGVLGINAGVVNINAASVTGGVPLGPGAKGGILGGGLAGNLVKFVLGPAGAAIIGAEIAAAINAPVIGPAREFEEGQVEAVLASKDATRIERAIQGIADQQNSDDILEQTALIASNIPFIGEALGNVGPKLDEQRQKLEAQLTEMGMTREQVQAAIRQGTSVSVSAFERSRASTADLLRLQTSRQEQSAQGLQQRVSEARNAINASGSRTAAGLGSVRAAQFGTTGAVREGTGVLRSLAGKKGDVIVKLTSNVSVSISDIQRKITSQQIAVGKGPLESF